ncbi:MAG TPA: hypothetical protein VF242_00390 [Nitrososphaeraceae archaeon]
MERKYNLTKFMIIVFPVAIMLVNVIFSKVSAIFHKDNCGPMEIIITRDNTGSIGSLYCNNNIAVSFL